MAKKKQIVECVPNFSEGRDMNVIKQITSEIEKTSGVKLLDVDPGEATNRTVVTFVGEPEAVVDAAFRAVAKAGELYGLTEQQCASVNASSMVGNMIPVTIGNIIGGAIFVGAFLYLIHIRNWNKEK